MAVRPATLALMVLSAAAVACGARGGESALTTSPEKPVRSAPFEEGLRPPSDVSAYEGSLVLDINRRLAANVGASATFRGWVYFAGDDGVHGQELMRTDGARVELVRDIRRGAAGAAITQIFAGPDRLYLLADDGVSGREVWVSDGTAPGTRLLLDTRPGAEGLEATELHFTARGSDVFFAVPAYGSPHRIFKTTGGAASEVAALPQTDPIDGLVATRSTVFGVYEDRGRTLFTLGASGIVPVASHAREHFALPAHRDNLRGLHVVGDRVLYAIGDDAHGVELHASDGTAAGTGMIAELGAGALSGLAGASRATVGGRHYFFGRAPAGSVALFATDGTAEGTALVAPVGAVGELAAAGDRLFALTDVDGVHGLYEVRGGALARVSAIAGRARDLFAVGDRLVYEVRGAGAAERFTSDGTTEGTTRLAGLPGEIEARPLGAVGGRLLFAARDALGDAQLWSFDALQASARVVSRLTSATASSSPRGLSTGAGGRVFFRADDGDGPQVWASAGDGAATVKLTSGAPDPTPTLAIASLGAHTYFAHAGALWLSDGTPAGTRTIQLGLDPDASVVESGGAIYATSAVGIFRVDAQARDVFAVSRAPGAPLVPSSRGVLFSTPRGVSLLEDGRSRALVELGGSPRLSGSVTLGAHTIFGVSGRGVADGVYATDGTAAGTTRLVASSTAELPRSFARVGGRAVFLIAGDLHATDGTAEGTTQILSGVARGAGAIALTPERIFAIAEGGDGVRRVFTSDGQIRARAIVLPGEAAPTSLAAHAGRALVIRAIGGGAEIVSTDGEDGGARIEARLDHVPAPGEWATAGGALLYSADTRAFGRELFALSAAR